MKWFQAKWLLLIPIALLAGVAAVFFAGRPPAPPNPNGYDLLKDLGVGIASEASKLTMTNSAAWTQFARAHTNLIADVMAAVALPSLAPRSSSTNAAAGLNFYGLTRALAACAQQAEADGDLSTATDGRLAIIQMAQQGTRGADSLALYGLSAAAQTIGLDGLSNSVPRLDATLARRAVDRLVQLQASREPAAHYVRRWRHWLVFGSGWWKDWSMARELPGAFSIRSKILQRDLRLQEFYANVVEALRHRLTELEAPPH